MVKTALLFPGQGSQVIGMAQKLAQQNAAARACLAQIDEALGMSLSGLMAAGPAETLQLTQHAQPAIFASSLASLTALKTLSGASLPQLCTYVAGHSLGEYSALCAAGVLDLAETAKLLRVRGEAMQAAVPLGEGAMAALLGADIALADEIMCTITGLVQIANDNAPNDNGQGQIVLSGETRAVHQAMEIAKEKGIRKVIELPVSAPFHCDLMSPAADIMAKTLEGSDMREAIVPIICNITARPETSPLRLRENLITQVTARVRWRETIDYLSTQGVTRFIELGTGKVLSGLVRRSVKDAEIFALDDADQITQFLSER